MAGKIRNGYQFCETIGESNLAKVKRAIRLKDGVTVAIKIYYHCTLRKKIKNGHDRIQKEFEFMSSSTLANHPNILKYYDIFHDPEKLYLVLEYCEASLEKFICSEVLDLSSVAKGLLSGLKFLGENMISHHDIKPGNLLIAGGTLKISDFGVAEQFDKKGGCRSCFGTPVYQPPEVVNFNPSPENSNFCNEAQAKNIESGSLCYDGTKADIWSAGVTIYQMSTGRLPFQQETLYLTLQQISHLTQAEVDSIIEENVIKPEMCSFIKKIMKVDPLERPPFEELLNHPYLRSLSDA
jgi:serine/threonine-protein kinase 11